MKYKFKYQITAGDFWQLSMYNTYGSIVGMCNIVFTVAMILLTGRFWSVSSYFVRELLILACCLFPIFQPIVIYIQSKKRIMALQKDIEIGFDDAGVHVKTGDQSSDLKWNTVRKISKKPTMLVILSTATHGFILTNKVLGKEKEAFYNYVISKINI